MADTDTTPTEDLVTMCRAAVRPWPPFDPTRMLDPIAAGANVMAIDGWCFPAWLAAKGLEPDVLAAILSAPGVDINAADEFGRTPILGATLTGGMGLVPPGTPNPSDDPVCVSMLLDAGADPCMVATTELMTPLSCAAGAGKARIVVRLLEDPRVRTRAHLTATSVSNSFAGTPEDHARKGGYHETADLIVAAIASL